MSDTVTTMKKCCGRCPYSKKNTLFLHPERAEEFAYQAENPYSDFICHKTGIVDDDNPDEDKQGDIIPTDKSLTCAGFYAMQFLINSDGEPEIVIDDDAHFSEVWDMVDHHQEHWDAEHTPQS